jgi:hypothetical protein
LTPDLDRRQLEICWRLMLILESRELDSFQMLVTGDESWYVLEYQRSTKRIEPRDETPTKVSQTIKIKRVMLTDDSGRIAALDHRFWLLTPGNDLGGMSPGTLRRSRNACNIRVNTRQQFQAESKQMNLSHICCYPTGRCHG